MIVIIIYLETSHTILWKHIFNDTFFWDEVFFVYGMYICRWIISMSLYVHDIVSYYVNIFFMIKFIEMKYFMNLQINEGMNLFYLFFIYFNVFLSIISYIVDKLGNGNWEGG